MLLYVRLRLPYLRLEIENVVLIDAAFSLFRFTLRLLSVVKVVFLPLLLLLL